MFGKQWLPGQVGQSLSAEKGLSANSSIPGAGGLSNVTLLYKQVDNALFSELLLCLQFLRHNKYAKEECFGVANSAAF